MATAIAAAKTDSSPILALSGEVPIDMEGLGEFQDASQATLNDTAVVKPLTRMSMTVVSARNLHHWLRHGRRDVGDAARAGASVVDARRACRRMHIGVRAGLRLLQGPRNSSNSPAAEAALALPAKRRTKIAFLAGAGVVDDGAATLRAVAER